MRFCIGVSTGFVAHFGKSARGARFEAPITELALDPSFSDWSSFWSRSMPNLKSYFAWVIGYRLSVEQTPLTHGRNRGYSTTIRGGYKALNTPRPPRVGGAHGLRTGVLNHTRIAPSVAPSVMTGALWRQAVRVCTRGRGSGKMS